MNREDRFGAALVVRHIAEAQDRRDQSRLPIVQMNHVWVNRQPLERVRHSETELREAVRVVPVAVIRIALKQW